MSETKNQKPTNIWDQIRLSEEERNLDPQTLGEANAAHILEKTSLENQQLQAKLERYRNQTKTQEKVGRNLVIFVMGWMSIVIFIVIAVGIGWISLPASVLNVMLGTTSLNILGLYSIYVKWLFPNK